MYNACRLNYLQLARDGKLGNIDLGSNGAIPIEIDIGLSGIERVGISSASRVDNGANDIAASNARVDSLEGSSEDRGAIRVGEKGAERDGGRVDAHCGLGVVAGDVVAELDVEPDVRWGGDRAVGEAAGARSGEGRAEEEEGSSSNGGGGDDGGLHFD